MIHDRHPLHHAVGDGPSSVARSPPVTSVAASSDASFGRRRAGPASRARLGQKLGTQSRVSRSVCWRAGRSRGPPVSSVRRSPSLRAVASGSAWVREAASSIASGNPSRQRQISRTSGSSASTGELRFKAAAGRRTGRQHLPRREADRKDVLPTDGGPGGSSP